MGAADSSRFGIYGADVNSPAMALGFNMVNGAATLTHLNNVAAAGKTSTAWLGEWDREACSFVNSDSWVGERVTEIAQHPSLAAYYMSDEPRAPYWGGGCANAIEAHEQRNQLIKAIDPVTPTMVVIDVTQSRPEDGRAFADWNDAADILAIVVYPIENGVYDPGFLQAKIDEARETVPRFWAVIQAFEDDWYTMPTAAQFEDMFARWRTTRGHGYEGFHVFSWSFANGLQDHPELHSVVQTEINSWDEATSGSGLVEGFGSLMEGTDLMATTGPQFPTANSGSSWNNAGNAHADQGSSSWCQTPTDGGTVTHVWSGFGFDTLIPVGADIDTVIVAIDMVYPLTGESPNFTIGAQPRVSGTPKGTEISHTGLTETRHVEQGESSDTWSRLDLLDSTFDVLVRGTHPAASDFGAIHYVTVTVEYTPSSVGGSGVVTAVGVLEGSGQAYMSGAAAVIGNGEIEGTGAVFRAGSGAVSGAGVVESTGSTSMSGDGGVSGVGRLFGVGEAPVDLSSFLEPFTTVYPDEVLVTHIETLSVLTKIPTLFMLTVMPSLSVVTIIEE